MPRLVAAAGCAVWSPLYRNAKPDDVAAAKALGLKVIPWTVNERADMERLIALGVDGLDHRLSGPPARRDGGEGDAAAAAGPLTRLLAARLVG